MYKTAAHHHALGQELFGELMEKEAKITGAQVPDVVSNEHAGIPYEARRRAYLDYVDRKAHEPHSSGGLATLVGAGVGGAVGALGGPVGAAVGAGVGGLTGYMMKRQDDADIQEARDVAARRRRVDDVLAGRMAARHTQERGYDRAHRSYEGAATRHAIRQSARNRSNVRINQYNTRVQNTSVNTRVSATQNNIQLNRY